MTLIDLDILRVIWWGLLGVLLIGFALTDGFDMGVGALLPFVGRTDLERRVAINTVGPVWEGNQVWFILGGGAIFAAWPPLYAVSFSGFYLAMFVVLAALILRPVAFKYRSKRDGAGWRSAWDWALFVGGAVPALIFGVAVGNVLQGVPFRFTEDLHSIYDGTFFGLLNPFALLAGVVSLTMLLTHGAAWLSLKAEGEVAARARAIGAVTGLVAIAGYALAGVWLAVGIAGYHFTGPVPADGASNPLLTEVARSGSWFAAYGVRPWIVLAPVFGFAGLADGGSRAAGGARGVHPAVVETGYLRGDLFGRADDVPVHPAVVDRPEIVADGLGRLVLADDPLRHAGGDGHLHADHPSLHRLGLQGAVGQGDRGRRDRKQP